MPSRTLRHKVAALNGSGVGKLGRLGSRTSWDRRAYAVSARSSKLGIVSVTRRVMGWRGLRGFLALGAVVFSVNLFSPWCAANGRGLCLLAVRLLEIARSTDLRFCQSFTQTLYREHIRQILSFSGTEWHKVNQYQQLSADLGGAFFLCLCGSLGAQKKPPRRVACGGGY